MALCFGLQYGHMNAYSGPFHWFDEFAVDVTPGDTYGHAIAWSGLSNLSSVRAATKWLGEPSVGFENGYKRLYDASASVWQWANNELIDGDFESATSVSANWTGTNASLSRSTSSPYAGTAFMRITPTTLIAPSGGSATEYVYAQGPSISVTSGQSVTMCFAARTAEPRLIRVGFAGKKSNDMVIPGDSQWHKYCVSFYASSNSSGVIRFYCGVIDDVLDIDQVFVAKANANLIYREFDNGVSVANMSDTAQTFSTTTRWLRITPTGGNAGDTPNNGTQITDAGGGVYTVSIPAWDGITMVRPSV
jgi:hypothetical protein